MSLMERGDTDNPPKWLICKKSLIPDMIAKQPEKMPVWEITGAEFSKSDVHTADGISIRFPRITKQREDKSYKEATNVKELNQLYEASKDCSNLQLLTDGLDDADNIEIKTKIQNFNKPNTSKSPIKSELKRIASEHDIRINEQSKTSPNKTMDSDMKRKRTENVEDKTMHQLKLKDISSADEKKIKTIKTEDKKRKLNYIDTDSSGDEEHLASVTFKPNIKIEKKPKIADIFAPKATSKKKNCSDSSANTASTTTAVGGGADVGDVIEPKALDDTQTNVTKKSDCDNVENNSKEISGKLAKNSDINIFEGVLLYVPTEVRDYVKEELRYFVLWGGIELNFAKKCTHVLHRKSSLTNDLNILRYIIFFLYKFLNLPPSL